MGRHGRQQLPQCSREVQEDYLKDKTGLDLNFLNASGSTKTCPKCSTPNRPSGRYYRCKNSVCGFTCHRDAVGAINIFQKVVYGEYIPIGPDTKVRVTYLRAVERWSPNQRTAQCQQARTLSSAQNRALSEVTQISKPKLADSSTSTDSSVPVQFVMVA